MFLTPTSTSYLTLLILSLAIAGYFLFLSRRYRLAGHNAVLTMLLAVSFTCFSYTIFLLFLNSSLHPNLAFFVMPLESVALALFLISFLQFAYRFPTLPPGWKREARIALGVTLAYALWEGTLAVERYASLAQGRVQYRPGLADFFPFAIFLWISLVFFRQTLRNSSAVAEICWWRKLVQSTGAGAAPHAVRALALLSLVALALFSVDILETRHVFSHDMAFLLQSLGALFTLAAFALVYLNYLPETTSFMVKLVGVSLAVMLAILGSLGWIIAPSYVAAYHNDSFVADEQTLRFSSNAQGGYDVARATFHFDTGQGTAVADSSQPTVLELPFDFPFYGQVWRQVTILDDGVIGLGPSFSPQDVKYRYGPTPAIFALYLDRTQEPDTLSGDSGLFTKATADRLTVTWSNLEQTRHPASHYTFQASLYPSGVFEITYHGLAAVQNYAIQNPSDGPWLIGAAPGSAEVRPDPVRFMADLPYVGSGRGGLVEDYYLDFRRYLHRLFSPLSNLIIASSVLIVVSFPVFLHLNLISPLARLLEGMRQINRGDLDVDMPVQFHDEIGFLTQSFNAMLAEMRSQTAGLHKRAAELEALTSISSALRQATTVDEMVSVLIEETVNVLQARSGVIFLLEDSRLVVAGSYGLDVTQAGRKLRPADIPCWPELQRGEMVQVDLAGQQQVCAGCILCQALAQGGEALAVVPLQAADQMLGLLQIAFERPVHRLKEDRFPLVAIAEMGGNALQRARTMEMLEQLVQDRTRELTALYEVTATTTRFLDIQTILERVLDKTLEVIGGQAVAVHLLDEGDEVLYQAAQRGTFPGLLDLVSAQTLSAGLWDLVVERREVVILRPQQVADALGIPLDESRAVIGLPIQTRGSMLGVLSAFAAAGQDFSVEDIVLLTGIVGHIGAAVESAQLRRQTKELAVQEERRRLARDLHDSVTQSLHSLVLSADTASYLLAQSRFEPLQDSLNRLKASASQALKEMRLLLFDLLLAPSEQMDLVALLQTRLEAVERRAGVQARLMVEGAGRWPEAWKGDLYGIALEALNNALWHARASQVSVHLRDGLDQLTLEVSDNGRGFDPTSTHSGIGLNSMAERARRLGGQLTVDSTPGAGTQVRLVIEREGVCEVL